MAGNRTVVLDHSVLDRMRVDPSFQEFQGCLGQLRAQAGVPRCRRCRSSTSIDVSTYNSVKTCLMSLPQAARNRLKAKLNADTLRAVGSGGSTITF